MTRASEYFRAHVDTVVHSIERATETNDEGVYVCNVTSASGSDAGEITVDVLGELDQRWILTFIDVI